MPACEDGVVAQDALHMGLYQLQSEVSWERTVGHRTVKHADSISTGRRALANARQTSFLCSQILQHWVLWRHLKQPAIGFSCLSSLAALLHPLLDSPSLAAGSVLKGRMPQHGRDTAQKSSSNQLNLPSFPRSIIHFAYRSMIHFKFHLKVSQGVLSLS